MHHTTVSGVSFFVDKRDDALVRKYRWAINGGKIRQMPTDGGKYLHQLICPHDGRVQFIDRNKLNLSRSNLSRRRGHWLPNSKTRFSASLPGIVRGVAKGGVFVFDAAQSRRVTPYTWSVRSDGYVTGVVEGRKTLLHRFLTRVTDRLAWVGHRNHDPRDNRMENLRICTPSQNNMNRQMTAGGTYFHKVSGKWMAQITKDGKCQYLGEFWSRSEAVRAYCEAAGRIHGEFAAPIVKRVLDSIDNL